MQGQTEVMKDVRLEMRPLAKFDDTTQWCLLLVKDGETRRIYRGATDSMLSTMLKSEVAHLVAFWWTELEKALEAEEQRACSEQLELFDQPS